MTKNDFFEAMNNIDASLIERADREVTVKKSRPMLKIAAIAACFAVLVAGIAAILPMLIGDRGNNIVTDALVWEDIAELFDPSGGNESELVLFPSSHLDILHTITDAGSDVFNGIEYTTVKMWSFVDDANIDGKKIEEVTVRMCWRKSPGGEETVGEVRAELYALDGVSTDAVVFLRYIEEPPLGDKNNCYLAVNSDYSWESLSGFYSDLSSMTLRDTVRILEYSNGIPDGKKVTYDISGDAACKIKSLLFSFDFDSAGIEHRYDAISEKIAGSKMIARISADICPIMNLDDNCIIDWCKCVNFYILDNGYIAISGIGYNFTFFNVGRENTDLFYETMKRCGEQIINPIDPDGDGLVEETTSATVNEVVPE